MLNRVELAVLLMIVVASKLWGFGAQEPDNALWFRVEKTGSQESFLQHNLHYLYLFLFWMDNVLIRENHALLSWQSGPSVFLSFFLHFVSPVYQPAP